MRYATHHIACLLAAGTMLLGCSDSEGPLEPQSVSESTLKSGSGVTFSGQATVVDAEVTTGLASAEVTLVDAGPLPPEGGADEETALTAEVPHLLTAEVLHASTVGQGNAARSEASVARVDLTVGGNRITAAFVMANARAVCKDGQVSLSGSSELVELDINGKRTRVTGEPNQTVDLGVGRIIINEQSKTQKSITVNALHVVIPGTADVVVSSAHADIGNCPAQCPPGADDFLTGGGWITQDGAKVNFGVGGGIKNGEFWGHLTLIDHGRRFKVKGTEVTGYEVVDATTRRIEGTARADGENVTYVILTADNGEPGRADTFEIRLSNGYVASGELDGGNIQLHGAGDDCD